MQSSVINPVIRFLYRDRDPVINTDLTSDYLRQELSERLATGPPLQYRLQIQTKTWNANKSVLNAAEAWNMMDHPWYDLAVVTLTNPLDEEALLRTRLNLNTTPDGLSLPPTERADDFTSLAHAMALLQNAESKPTETSSVELVKYQITIQTGDVAKAGTDADVIITITGMLKTFF